MKNYKMHYRIDSPSKFSHGKSADVAVYTATIQAPNATTARNMLVKREASAGIGGRKIHIIRTLNEKGKEV